MRQQILRGHDDGEVLDGARPDQGAPSRPQAALVGARGHEDQLGAAQRKRPRHFRHVDLAAHGEAHLAVARVEHRELVARDVLEFPPWAAGVDPWAIGMGPAVARRRAPVRVGHDDEVVGGCGGPVERLDRAEHRVHAVLDRGFRERRRRIERRGHAPRTRVGLGEADEIGALVRRVLDEIDRVGDVGLTPLDRLGERLDDGDTEGHGGAFRWDS